MTFIALLLLFGEEKLSKARETSRRVKFPRDFRCQQTVKHSLLKLSSALTL